MKSKKSKKILGAIAGLALVLVASIALAGSDSNVGFASGMEVVRNAAHNYFDNRTGYENFADTTIESVLSMKTKTMEEANTYYKKIWSVRLKNFKTCKKRKYYKVLICNTFNLCF